MVTPASGTTTEEPSPNTSSEDISMSTEADDEETKVTNNSYTNYYFRITFGLDCLNRFIKGY
jgi:hypothetical protein